MKILTLEPSFQCHNFPYLNAALAKQKDNHWRSDGELRYRPSTLTKQGHILTGTATAPITPTTFARPYTAWIHRQPLHSNAPLRKGTQRQPGKRSNAKVLALEFGRNQLALLVRRVLALESSRNRPLALDLMPTNVLKLLFCCSGVQSNAKPALRRFWR